MRRAECFVGLLVLVLGQSMLLGSVLWWKLVQYLSSERERFIDDHVNKGLFMLDWGLDRCYVAVCCGQFVRC